MYKKRKNNSLHSWDKILPIVNLVLFYSVVFCFVYKLVVWDNIQTAGKSAVNLEAKRDDLVKDIETLELEKLKRQSLSVVKDRSSRNGYIYGVREYYTPNDLAVKQQ